MFPCSSEFKTFTASATRIRVLEIVRQFTRYACVRCILSFRYEECALDLLSPCLRKISHITKAEAMLFRPLNPFFVRLWLYLYCCISPHDLQSTLHEMADAVPIFSTGELNLLYIVCQWPVRKCNPDNILLSLLEALHYKRRALWAQYLLRYID